MTREKSQDVNDNCIPLTQQLYWGERERVTVCLIIKQDKTYTHTQERSHWCQTSSICMIRCGQQRGREREQVIHRESLQSTLQPCSRGYCLDRRNNKKADDSNSIANNYIGWHFSISSSIFHLLSSRKFISTTSKKRFSATYQLINDWEIKSRKNRLDEGIINACQQKP